MCYSVHVSLVVYSFIVLIYISLVTRYMYMYYFYISLCNYIHVLRCSYFIVCYVQHYSVYHVSDWLLYTRTCIILIIFHCRLLCTHTQMYNIIVFIFHLLSSICIVVLIHIIICYLSRLLILLKCYATLLKFGYASERKYHTHLFNTKFHWVVLTYHALNYCRLRGYTMSTTRGGAECAYIAVGSS